MLLRDVLLWLDNVRTNGRLTNSKKPFYQGSCTPKMSTDAQKIGLPFHLSNIQDITYRVRKTQTLLQSLPKRGRLGITLTLLKIASFQEFLCSYFRLIIWNIGSAILPAGVVFHNQSNGNLIRQTSEFLRPGLEVSILSWSS
ncbi:hypothetical protein QYF36_021481 [Acer negundo]|nr:hypothetical protein QYF36_021481 [Acer negundo]